MFYQVSINFPIWIPSAGWIAAWMVCGGLAMPLLMLLVIQIDSEKSYQTAISEDAVYKPRKIVGWLPFKVLLAGPLILILAVAVIFFERPRRLRREENLREENIKAYMSNKTFE